MEAKDCTQKEVKEEKERGRHPKKSKPQCRKKRFGQGKEGWGKVKAGEDKIKVAGCNGQGLQLSRESRPAPGNLKAPQSASQPIKLGANTAICPKKKMKRTGKKKKERAGWKG